MLKINNLHSAYNKIEVLHGISMTVPKNRLVVVIGRNGAGKSTLLKTISGLVKIKSGSITFDGEPLPSAPHKIVGKGVVHVPEGRRIFPSLTVEENLLMGGYLTKGSEFDECKQAVFDFFPVLKDRRHQQAGTLSGGEQQMLAMGRGLMGKPKLLLLDEPSLGLAPIVFGQVFDLIENLRDQGEMTILLVEQNASVALQLADYAYVLEDGQITMEGKGSDCLHNPKVKEAYLGA